MPFPIRITDVMSSPVHTTSRDATAADAAATCTEEGIGSLVVVEGGEPVGIVTTTDLVALLGTAADPQSRSVSEFMSSPVITVAPDEPVRDAVAQMEESGVGRLVVVDDGELVGVVSKEDVFRHVPQVLHRHQCQVPSHQEYHYRARQETAYERPDWEFECMCISEESVSVGDRVSFTKTLTDEDVQSFAAASGDTNRLHLDDEYAAETRFGRRIVHGTLVGGLISAALARLPGLTIYISQDLSFLAPVDIGDRVTAVCEIVESFGGNKYELTTDVLDEDGEQVVEGEAAVLIDEPPATAGVEFEAVT